MLNKYIDIINYISTFSCIIPLVIYWNNKKTIFREFNLISIYLIICLIVETILAYTFINSIKVKNIGVSFVVIELLILSIYFWNLFDNFFKRILSFLIYVTLLLYIIKILDLYTISINLFFGGTKVILILIGLNILLSSFLVVIPRWKLILNYSILQYSTLGVVISAFADFFISHREYLGIYNLINSLNNLVFYVLLTISIIQCKKQFSQA